MIPSQFEQDEEVTALVRLPKLLKTKMREAPSCSILHGSDGRAHPAIHDQGRRLQLHLRGALGDGPGCQGPLLWRRPRAS
jgi:hypothetical protein